MGVKHKVTIKGLRELERKLEKLPRELESEAETATKAEAEEVYKAMREAAPKASGMLEGAVGRRRMGPLSYHVGVLGAKRAWWAAIVEFGASTRPATPFAEPAAREAESRYANRMAKYLNGMLRPT
jgi:HK97 gp10 family phage protein